METYSLLRQFGDSWMLLFLFLFFVGAVVWAFRPGSRPTHRDAAIVPSRNEDAPMGGRVMATERKIDKGAGIETTGHTWDRIEELNTPLPLVALDILRHGDLGLSSTPSAIPPGRWRPAPRTACSAGRPARRSPPTSSGSRRRTSRRASLVEST